jgi:aryl-alcohol dehydrogenase-like predicted oxidoreductase
VSEVVKCCFERGINFFDTAEEYLSGRSEIFLGNAIKELQVPRKDVVISTKIFWGNYDINHLDSINDLGLSRKHIIEGLRASLKRL